MTRLEGGGGLLRLGHEVPESGEHVPPFPVCPRHSHPRHRAGSRRVLGE